LSSGSTKNVHFGAIAQDIFDGNPQWGPGARPREGIWGTKPRKADKLTTEEKG